MFGRSKRQDIQIAIDNGGFIPDQNRNISGE